MAEMNFYTNESINPFGGACAYNCKYCWARMWVEKYNLQEKYSGPPKFDERVLRKRFGSEDKIFVTSMTDPCNPDIPLEWHFKIFDWMKGPRNRDALFLYLSKNPEYYGRFIIEGKRITLDSELFPKNLQLGATIETNKDEGYSEISNAPLPSKRITAMKQLRGWTDNDLFLSIEPILRFDLESFVEDLKEINPAVIAIGRDNYGNSLLEPTHEEFEVLCEAIEGFTTLHRK